jgi:hypothetical protein
MMSDLDDKKSQDQEGDQMLAAEGLQGMSVQVVMMEEVVTALRA